MSAMGVAQLVLDGLEAGLLLVAYALLSRLSRIPYAEGGLLAVLFVAGGFLLPRAYPLGHATYFSLGLQAAAAAGFGLLVGLARRRASAERARRAAADQPAGFTRPRPR